MQQPPDKAIATVTAACIAMGTRFEIIAWGAAEWRLRAAAGQALDEIRRLHGQLSAFDPASDVWAINAHAAVAPVRTDGRVLRLLERCRELHLRTGGVFDVTVGALMARWGFRGASGDRGAEEAVVGMEHVVLDHERGAVSFARAGVALDLGAVAKGYALDEAGDVLRECGIGGALLHGGTSSILAVGTDPEGKPWRVAIRHPERDDEPLAVVGLVDRALGVSALHGRTILRDGAMEGHVMDPRNARPARGVSLAAVACASCADADALSTALLVLGDPFAEELRAQGCEAWTA